MTPSNYADLVEPARVHRAVYADPAVYAAEVERIFRRVWLYVGHDSEIPAEGDFVRTRLGPDDMVLVRQRDGSAALLHNRCPHRGARLVTVARGRVQQFVCGYHAWRFGHDGACLGVPQPSGYRDARAGDPASALQRVPRVDSYRGFIFGSQAPDGPDLGSFLGPMTSALDNLIDRAPAGTVTLLPDRLRMEYRGNWKLFIENIVDLVHPPIVHASAVAAARADPDAANVPGNTGQVVQMQLANGLSPEAWDRLSVHAFPGGHAYMENFYRGGVIGTDRDDGDYGGYRDALARRLGIEAAGRVLAVNRFNNVIWPTLAVNAQFQSLRLIQPVAVDRTIVTNLCFRLDGAPDSIVDLARRFVTAAGSPASPVAADDLELFERCQRGLGDRAGDWIDLGRGVDADLGNDSGAWSAAGTSELPMRNQLRAWRHWMSDAP